MAVGPKDLKYELYGAVYVERIERIMDERISEDIVITDHMKPTHIVCTTTIVNVPKHLREFVESKVAEKYLDAGWTDSKCVLEDNHVSLALGYNMTL